jgi:hypothetical protein
MPGKSLEKQKDRIYALKLTRMRVQRYNNIKIQIRTPRGLFITNHSFCSWRNSLEFSKSSGNKLTEAKTPREAIHDAFSSRPPPTPAPSPAWSHRATHHWRHYLDQHIIARLGILILSKSYPSVISTSPILDHERLFGYWVAFAKK